MDLPVINRILMLRKPGVSHPIMQQIGNGVKAVAPRAWQENFLVVNDVRVTDTGDHRVTSSGDTRVVNI